MTLEQYLELKQFAPYHSAGRISTNLIATELAKTPQHVRRLLKRLPMLPVKRIAWNKLTPEIRQYVVQTKTGHRNYNCQWISELASDQFERNVSQSSVWRILDQNDLLHTPAPMRKVRSRFEAQECGDLIQMDTTWGYWWNGKRLCLVLLLDDYSRYILHARFVLSDSADANMQMIRETVGKYGIFKLLYTDNASFFKVIRHNRSWYQTHSQETYETEITRACREVGIVHLTHRPYEPQGKGKIERLFRFIQERLIEDIATDESQIPFYVLEKKLARFVEWYNNHHINRTIKTTPKERFNQSKFTPLPADKCLDDIFCLKDTRTVDKCNEFSYMGERYTIPKGHNLCGWKVNLHILPKRSIRVWHTDRLIATLEMKQRVKQNINNQEQ